MAVPVDVKRGAAPDIPEGAYEPERVQVCAQGLILRENGYACDHGELYFAKSRRRVRVDLDDAWFSVRRSNTESVLRLYTEAPTREAAVAIADRVEKQIHEITLAGGADEGAITP